MPADPTIPASSVIGRACLDGWRGPVTHTGRAFDTDGPRECVLLGPDSRPESERIGPWLVSATDGEGWYVLDCLCEVLSVAPDDLALDLSRREIRLRVADVLGQGVGSIPAHDARHLLDGPPLGTAGITAEQSAILLAAHVAGVEAGGPGVRGTLKPWGGDGQWIVFTGRTAGGLGLSTSGGGRLVYGAPEELLAVGYALLDADGGVRVPS